MCPVCDSENLTLEIMDEEFTIRRNKTKEVLHTVISGCEVLKCSNCENEFYTTSTYNRIIMEFNKIQNRRVRS